MTITKLLKNSVQHIARNKGLAFASIMVMTLTFLIMFTFVGVLYSVTKMIDYLDKKIPVIVMVENTATPQDRLYLESTIRSLRSDVTMTFYDNNFSLDKYLKDNEGSPSLTYGVSADLLPGYYEVNVPTQKDALDLFDNLLQKLSTKVGNPTDVESNPNAKTFKVGSDVYLLKDNYNFVYTVILRASTSKFLNDVKGTAQIVGIVVAAFLIIVTLILIFVTTSMTIYTSKDEIETMELVGATPSYVRIPYVFDGALYGFIGATLSTILLYLSTYLLIQNNNSGIIPFFKNFFRNIEWTEINPKTLAILFGIFVLSGAFIGASAAAIATRKYLRK